MGVFVNPRTLPGMPKAWVEFVGATGAILAAHNISSITRNGVGGYTLNIAAGALQSANYAAVGMCSNDSVGANIPGSVSVNPGQSATQLTIQVRDSTSGPVDRTVVSVAIFGA